MTVTNLKLTIQSSAVFHICVPHHLVLLGLGYLSEVQNSLKRVSQALFICFSDLLLTLNLAISCALISMKGSNINQSS